MCADGEVKKLIEAARYWAGERLLPAGAPSSSKFSVDLAIVDQLKEVGAPPEVIQAALDQANDAVVEEGEEEEDFFVWLESWPDLLFFLSLRGQWNLVCSPMGMLIRTGLPNSAVQSAMELLRTPDRKRKALFQVINQMEEAVLEVDRERLKKESQE